MSSDNSDLRSYQFRKEREANWRELESLARRIERGRVRGLTFDEVLRLPNLYRGVLSSLSVARAISLDKGLIRYLESLAARSYMAVYGSQETFVTSARNFLQREFPAAVMASLTPLLIAAIALFGGAILGYWIVASDPELYFLLIPEYMAQGRTPFADPETLRMTIYDSGGHEGGGLSDFASMLFVNNSMVAIMAFALGFAAGLPTILLLIYNGLLLGAMVRAFAMHDLGYDFVAWLSIHGTTELLAIVLAGAGGLVMGSSIIFPGRYTRMDNLAANGRRAGQIVTGVVLMLAIAGLLEGFGRQLIQSAEIRLLIGGAFLAFWYLYFTRAGRA